MDIRNRAGYRPAVNDLEVEDISNLDPNMAVGEPMIEYSENSKREGDNASQVEGMQ